MRKRDLLCFLVAAMLLRWSSLMLVAVPVSSAWLVHPGSGRGAHRRLTLDPMINFRYHLVSLTAVFLALAIGIAMGATVVDQATVKRAANQLESVRSRARHDQRRERLAASGGERWRRFVDQGDELVRGAAGQRPARAHRRRARRRPRHASTSRHTLDHRRA